jgi:hypothetical protein
MMLRHVQTPHHAHRHTHTHTRPRSNSHTPLLFKIQNHQHQQRQLGLFPFVALALRISISHLNLKPAHTSKPKLPLTWPLAAWRLAARSGSLAQPCDRDCGHQTLPNFPLPVTVHVRVYDSCGKYEAGNACFISHKNYWLRCIGCDAKAQTTRQ